MFPAGWGDGEGGGEMRGERGVHGIVEWHCFNRLISNDFTEQLVKISNL